VNSLALADSALVGASTGLGANASYVVLGARAGLNPELVASGKLKIDPSAPNVRMATVGAAYSNAFRYSAGLSYTFIGADAGIGQLADQHEITGSGGIPLDDYWTATATASWDLAANTWLEAGVGIGYDDGYLDFGVNALVTGPTASTPNDIQARASIHLKGPAGKYGFGQ
jgi:LPS-assembly protein